MLSIFNTDSENGSNLIDDASQEPSSTGSLELEDGYVKGRENNVYNHTAMENKSDLKDSYGKRRERDAHNYTTTVCIPNIEDRISE